MKNYKKITRRAFRKWSKGGRDIYTLLSPDVQWTNTGASPVSKVYHGREKLLSEYVRPFNLRLRNALVPDLENVYADGRIVIVVWKADTIAADGIPYHNTYCWHLTFRKKLIIEVTAFFDSISLAELWDRVPVSSPVISDKNS